MEQIGVRQVSLRVAPIYPRFAAKHLTHDPNAKVENRSDEEHTDLYFRRR